MRGLLLQYGAVSTVCHAISPQRRESLATDVHASFASRKNSTGAKEQVLSSYFFGISKWQTYINRLTLHIFGAASRKGFLAIPQQIHYLTTTTTDDRKFRVTIHLQLAGSVRARSKSLTGTEAVQDNSFSTVDCTGPYGSPGPLAAI